MITKLQYHISPGMDPYENLATEKYLLEHVSPGCCILYLWQNENTVVIGRNQNPWVECRLSLLEQEGGKLARRLSGGGAVFHDKGNLNFTFLVNAEDYDLQKQLSVIQTACAYAGIATERSGRNDVLAHGAKFSGNAFYQSQGKAYHHGTLLIDVDMEKLGRYLSPSKAKLQAKGVSSVRSRVVNLNTLCPGLDCDTMKTHMLRAFEQVYGLTATQAPIPPSLPEETARMGSWDWLYGKKLPMSFTCEDRFHWGGIQLQLQCEAGKVLDAKVYSDSMDWTLAPKLEQALTGCRFLLPELIRAVRDAIADPAQASDICSLLEKQEL